MPILVPRPYHVLLNTHHFLTQCASSIIVRMAKTAKRLNAILDYMKKVKSSISMVFGLVF